MIFILLLLIFCYYSGKDAGLKQALELNPALNSELDEFDSLLYK